MCADDTLCLGENAKTADDLDLPQKLFQGQEEDVLGHTFSSVAGEDANVTPPSGILQHGSSRFQFRGVPLRRIRRFFISSTYPL